MQFELRRGVLDVVPRLLEPRVQVVERYERGDGDAQTERGGEQRLRNAAGDGLGRVQLLRAEPQAK